MERNVILAIVLSVIVLVVYNIFFFKSSIISRPVTEPAPGQVEKEKISLQTFNEFTIKKKHIELTFSSLGGKIISWKAKGKELISKDGSALALDLTLPNGQLIRLANEVMEAKIEEDKRVIFLWKDQEKKYQLTKVIEISNTEHAITVNISLEGFPPGSTFQLPWQGELGEKNGDEEQLAFSDGQVYEQNKTGGKSYYDENIRWLGVRKKKDLLAIMIPLTTPKTAAFQRNSWGIESSRLQTVVILYAGPPSYSELRLMNSRIKEIKGEDYHLTEAIKSSWWGSLAIGLQRILIFFYSFTHNYGIAIILLTLLIYGILFPLNMKQFESMQKMQVVQPELKSVQEKYKKEPKRLQMEMMKVYQKHKINPMAGCLPMIIQLPIIFILYRALLNFNFSENPSFLWIPNLGEPNVPLLLGLAGMMFLQQRISRKVTVAQSQEGLGKMMQFFPIIMIAFLWSLPSGVMLYWFTSTLVSMLQQLLIRRKTQLSSKTQPTTK